MLNNMQITTQPIFYLFIAFSIMLSLAYFRGRRKNKKIYLSAFTGIRDIIKPSDEEYTNIGGLTGYHARFAMKGNSRFKLVEATVTLLPRQSILYYPVSRLLMKFDRLFISFTLKKNIPPTITEAHLIEKKFSTFKTLKIRNPDAFTIETVQWGNRDFLLYYSDTKGKTCFNNLLAETPDPGGVRHLAVVPEHNRLFVFMIPAYGKTAQWFASVYPWIKGLAAL